MDRANGLDEAGNGFNGVEEVEENFVDAEDGQCFGRKEKPDERDARGRPGIPDGEIVARMPVERNATHYNMNHRKRGLAIIFNHENFECGNLKSRAGTEADCKQLKGCLSNLHFDVHVYKDLTAYEVEDRIRRTAQEDHSDRDCLLITVLSHGECGIIYAKDRSYVPDTLWSLFRADLCPTLAGKPKIFFLQACQGDKLDKGVTLSRTETDGEIHSNYKIPAQADFLVVYSTYKGYYSWRNTTYGSWFVQSLVKELTENAYKMDLVTLLTFVSQRVAIHFESNVPTDPTMHRQKQIPCIMSMLTRLIQFNVKQ
ncbi:unnamed protein product [Phyllotreta striolata]|uniref:Caspase-1 n=1 Tax=Phyllotreta striolata TaxID=444603 RepID=A0A9N9XNM7_PHYSR|nr:unnamed protein product [Phyllotreta striolata]